MIKKKHFGWAVFSVITWEVVEELIEEVIAFWLSSAFALFITKTITTLGIVFATIGLKKLLFRIFKPIIKSITYKEGNDKMTKIKKFFTWIFANKKTLIGTLSASVMTLSGTGVIDVSALPDLTIKGFNITPVLYYGVLAVLALLGVFGKGFEKIEEFFARMKVVKAEKEQKLIDKATKKEQKLVDKTAEKRLAKSQKEATQTQADKEKIEAKQKAEEEFNKKVEQRMAELKAKQG